MAGQLLQALCSTCHMREFLDGDCINEQHTYRKCCHYLQLECWVMELERGLEALRSIWENESYVDSMYKVVVTLWCRRIGTVTHKHKARQVVQQSPKAIPMANWYCVLSPDDDDDALGNCSRSKTLGTVGPSAAQRREKKVCQYTLSQLTRMLISTIQQFKGQFATIFSGTQFTISILSFGIGMLLPGQFTHKTQHPSNAVGL
eukprot:g42791.t1